MNIVTPVETPEGARLLVTLTPDEARQRMRHATPAEAESLRLATHPEDAYGENYAMPGYVPGWQA